MSIQNHSFRAVRVIVVLVVLAGAIGAGVWMFTGDGAGLSWGAAFTTLIRWVQSQGMMAAVWLVALQALLVVLVIPGPFFTMGAGFLFGLAGGSVVAVAGSTLGAVIAYGFSRLFQYMRNRKNRGSRHGGEYGSMYGSMDGGDGALYSRTSGSPHGTAALHPAHEHHAAVQEGAHGWGHWLASHPRLHLLARVVRDGGWTVVLSTRLLPFFPFKLSNYFFGWMRFPFAPFFWGTLVGLIPITMVSVSAGALASDLSGLTSPDLTAGRGWIWSLATLGLGVVVLLGAGVRARARYREALSREAHDVREGAQGGAARPDNPVCGPQAGPGRAVNAGFSGVRCEETVL